MNAIEIKKTNVNEIIKFINNNYHYKLTKENVKKVANGYRCKFISDSGSPFYSKFLFGNVLCYYVTSHKLMQRTKNQYQTTLKNRKGNEITFKPSYSYQYNFTFNNIKMNDRQFALNFVIYVNTYKKNIHNDKSNVSAPLLSIDVKVSRKIKFYDDNHYENVQFTENYNPKLIGQLLSHAMQQTDDAEIIDTLTSLNDIYKIYYDNAIFYYDDNNPQYINTKLHHLEFDNKSKIHDLLVNKLLSKTELCNVDLQ